MPELVFAELDADLARTEPGPEILAPIRASAGLNLALDYRSSAVMFDPQRADSRSIRRSTSRRRGPISR